MPSTGSACGCRCDIVTLGNTARSAASRRSIHRGIRTDVRGGLLLWEEVFVPCGFATSVRTSSLFC